jgi:hypothetical protein
VPIYIGDPDGLTWQDARQKVRGDLWRPGNSLPDDQVDRALHASVLDLEGEAKWLWLEQLTTIVSLDEDADGIDLPLTVSRVTSIAVRRDAYAEPMNQQPIQTVRANVGSDIGDPSAWAMGDSRIWFDSRAQVGTEFEIVLSIATPRRLELALQSPSYTLAVEQQAVIAKACSYLALNFMKNADEAARQRAVYDSILERLLDVEADQRGGMIQADTWGMGCYGR